MISFTCDNCEHRLEVDDRWAGQKYECEHCGDINRVPNPSPKEPASAPAPLDRAQKAGLPPDSGEEVRVRFVRPVMFRAKPIRFVITASITLAGIVGLIWFGAMGRNPPWIAWPSGIAAVLGLGSLGWWKLATLARGLDVTNKRTTVIEGLLSKSTSEVLHDNIRNIQIDQSFWQRIWRVGSLGISSSGQDGIEVYIRDIPDPHDLREIIDLYRPL